MYYGYLNTTTIWPIQLNKNFNKLGKKNRFKNFTSHHHSLSIGGMRN